LPVSNNGDGVDLDHHPGNASAATSTAVEAGGGPDMISPRTRP